MPEEEKKKPSEQLVDLDTSGPEVDVDVETKEQDTVEQDKTYILNKF